MRMAATAKAWGVKPSSYLPELNTYEAFAFDELCAVVLSMKEKEAFDEARKKREQNSKAGPTRIVGRELPPDVDPLDWMMSFK